MEYGKYRVRTCIGRTFFLKNFYAKWWCSLYMVELKSSCVKIETPLKFSWNSLYNTSVQMLVYMLLQYLGLSQLKWTFQSLKASVWTMHLIESITLSIKGFNYFPWLRNHLHKRKWSESLPQSLILNSVYLWFEIDLRLSVGFSVK